MNKSPCISLITVVFNNKTGLELTIKSISEQTYKNFELIVIDGYSNDGTIDIIDKYKDTISYSVVENDKGIYDAMNKGLDLASGEFVNFLNAGDTLYERDTLKKISLNISDFDSVYFSRAKVSFGGSYWIYPSFTVNDYDLWLRRNLPNHQAMFFPKSFYSSVRYDLRLKITGDDDYKLIALKSCSVEFIDQIFIEFERDGLSSNHKSLSLFLQRIKESIIINLKHMRLLRLFVDPFKRLLTFLIHSIFGGKVFFNFIKKVKGL